MSFPGSEERSDELRDARSCVWLLMFLFFWTYGSPRDRRLDTLVKKRRLRSSYASCFLARSHLRPCSSTAMASYPFGYPVADYEHVVL